MENEVLRVDFYFCGHLAKVKVIEIGFILEVDKLKVSVNFGYPELKCVYGDCIHQKDVYLVNRITDYAV